MERKRTIPPNNSNVLLLDDLSVVSIIMMAARSVLILVLLATPSLSVASSSRPSSSTRTTKAQSLWGGFTRRWNNNQHPLSLFASTSTRAGAAASTSAATVAGMSNPVSLSFLFLTIPSREQRSQRHQQQEDKPTRKRRLNSRSYQQRRWQQSSSPSSTTSALGQTSSSDDYDINDDGSVSSSTFGMEEISIKRLIEIKSQVDLPFSADIAYDAYSNLPRQPSWSSWLDSVVFLDKNSKDGDSNRDNDMLASRWTMKFLGIKYSFEAIALRNERPWVMQWKSTTGLQNFGTVEFHPKPENPDTTTMKLTMAFVAPRPVSALFRKNTKIASYVERNLITKSLHDFRDVVVKTDLQQQQQDQKKCDE